MFIKLFWQRPHFFCWPTFNWQTRTAPWGWEGAPGAVLPAFWGQCLGSSDPRSPRDALRTCERPQDRMGCSHSPLIVFPPAEGGVVPRTLLPVAGWSPFWKGQAPPHQVRPHVAGTPVCSRSPGPGGAGEQWGPGRCVPMVHPQASPARGRQGSWWAHQALLSGSLASTSAVLCLTQPQAPCTLKTILSYETAPGLGSACPASFPCGAVTEVVEYRCEYVVWLLVDTQQPGASQLYLCTWVGTCRHTPPHTLPAPHTPHAHLPCSGRDVSTVTYTQILHTPAHTHPHTPACVRAHTLWARTHTHTMHPPPCPGRDASTVTCNLLSISLSHQHRSFDISLTKTCQDLLATKSQCFCSLRITLQL